MTGYEYQWWRTEADDPAEQIAALNELGAQGWHVVPNTVQHGHLLLERSIAVEA